MSEKQQSVQNTLSDSFPLDGDNSCDTLSVIAKLVEAADILLHKKDYDGHGWEEIEICYKRGLKILQQHKMSKKQDNCCLNKESHYDSK